MKRAVSSATMRVNLTILCETQRVNFQVCGRVIFGVFLRERERGGGTRDKRHTARLHYSR